MNAQAITILFLLAQVLYASCRTAAPGSQAATAQNQTRKPNIIVIVTDDHGWPDIGAAEVYSDLKTPHINAFAASGIRATSGYVTAPQCVPSRAGLLTGISPNKFGVEQNEVRLDGFNAQQTIAERLKRVGYATGLVGKWHLGRPEQIGQHGFDDIFLFEEQQHVWRNFDFDGNELNPPRTDVPSMYRLDAKTTAARAFIKRHQNEPFFLYLAYQAPHVPLDAPNSYLARFPGKMPERRRQALAMLAAIDDGVGNLQSDLRSYGIENDTLIFFIGDNGAPTWIYRSDTAGGGPGWDGSLNGPMNGEKGTLLEGGIRTPYLISWPAKLPAGRIYHEPVSSLDIAATAIAAAGLPPDQSLDGVNLIPFISGNNTSSPHPFLAWRWVAQSAIREGNWKFIKAGPSEYLFDLSKDVGETNNIATVHPGKVVELRKKLSDWSGTLNPPGLEAGALTKEWREYFDFYVDAKSPPTPNVIDGWVPRESIFELYPDSLGIKQTTTGRPFVAQNGLDLRGLSRFVITVQATTAGDIALAWRKNGQADFPSQQIVTNAVSATQGFASYELSLPSSEDVVHVRVWLPPGLTRISRMDFYNSRSDLLRSWSFPSQRYSPPTQNVQGWTAENGTALALGDGVLRINQDKLNSAVAIVHENLPVSNLHRARVRLYTFSAGKLELAWRTSAQTTFPDNQTTTVNLPKSTNMADYEFSLTHQAQNLKALRLKLPTADAAIAEIEFFDFSNQSIARWTF